MDTKLKKYSHSIWVKIILFILVIFFFTNSILKTIELFNFKDGYVSVVFESSFYDSQMLEDYRKDAYNKIQTLIFYYGDEEKIKSGKSIKKEHLDFRKENRFLDELIDTQDFDKDLDEFYEKNPEVEEEIKNQMIKEQLRNYKVIKRNLETDEKFNGLIYYATDGNIILTNTRRNTIEDFKKYPVYFLNASGDYIEYPNRNIQVYNNYDYPEDMEFKEIFIGLEDDLVEKLSNSWQKQKAISDSKFKELLVYISGLIISFIIYVSLVGRNYWQDDEVSFNTFDRLFTDINVIFCIILIVIWGIITLEILGINTNISGVGRDLENIYYVLRYITVGIGSLGLLFVTSLIKHLKNRSLIKNSLIYFVFSNIINFFRDIFNSSSIGKKTVFLVIVYPIIVVASLLLFPLTIAFAASLALRKTKKFEQIQDGVMKIKEGNLSHKIDIKDNGELGKLSKNINTISSGLEKAIENELKSERMKSELITNVSHDIRTPLTSIITYIDLLKSETDEAKKEDYLEVLENKSERLKVLIDNLFEASKVSSGTIPVNLEKIDIISLLNQGLGELDDKIKETELEFILDLPDKPLYINADGDLLWRAIQNILSNIFKYSLHGSRVYIDLGQDDDYAYLTIKNISAYELNISEEELMERFKRGDESRSSEGSGLGLSIAQSLVEIQKGKFSINIDGDLFKSNIRIPKFK